MYITIRHWPETEQGSFRAAQTPIQTAYSANLTVQVDSDLCMCCIVYAEGQTSKFSRFNFTDACDHAHLIYTLYNHVYIVAPQKSGHIWLRGHPDYQASHKISVDGHKS